MNKKAFTAFVLCLFFTPFGLFFISLQGIRHAAGAPDLFLRCTWERIGCAQAVRRRVSGEYPAAWLHTRSGDSCAQGGTAARPWVYAVSRSWSGLFVVSIGYTLTIRRKQHEKRFTRVIKRIMKRIIITIYPIDTNAHIAYT